MQCPICKNEIADDAGTCPECGEVFESAAKTKKDSKKEFTHYRIILLKPGSREDIADLLSEITGLSANDVARKLKHLPWELVSRIPLDKAQEIKILLETSRATVQLEGMNIWEEEHLQERTEQEPVPEKSSKKLAIVIALSIIALGTAGLTYFIQNIDKASRQGFLRNLQADIPDISEDYGVPVGEITEDALLKDILPESFPENTGIPESPKQSFNLRDDGTNPYDPLIVIRFDINKTSPVILTLYDQTFTKIATLLQGILKPESYRVRWNGATDTSPSASPGIYFVLLTIPTGNASHKIAWLADKK